MARRRYQNGSLNLVGRRWVLTYREDVAQPDGTVKRKQVYKTIGYIETLPTKREARRKADLALADVRSIDYAPGQAIYLREMAERWEQLMAVALKAGTRGKAKQHLNAHILPAFGDLTLDRICQEDVQRFAIGLRMQPHSVRNVLGTLNSICKTARTWGYSVGRWSLADVALPKQPPRKERPFEVAEVRAILLRAAQPWRSIYALAVLAALRGGEVLALGVDDLRGDEMRVHQSLGPNRELQDVKTSRSNRTVPICQPLREILDDHLQTTWRRNDAGLLFCTRDGRPLSHTKILERHLWPLLDELGIERRGLHAFRHSAASVLIASGAPLTVVQRILGHASTATTLGIYGHVLGDDARSAVSKLGQILLADVCNAGVKPLQVN